MKIEYENIMLASISESDLEDLRSWRNDSEWCKYLRNIGHISKEDQYNWHLKQKEDKDAITLGIHETKELNRLVGSISLYDIKPNDTAEIGRILIGHPEAHGKGIGRNAMKALIDYGFKTYNLKQITLSVHRDNVKAYSIYKSLGFIKIGERKPNIDMYEDIMILYKDLTTGINNDK